MNIASIGSLEDALLLYDDAVAYWSELQEALAAAMNWLQEAMLDFHKTQDHLGEADFQLGKTQYIFRKSGYGEILSKKHGAGFLKVDGVVFIPFFSSTDSLFAYKSREGPALYCQARLNKFCDCRCKMYSQYFGRSHPGNSLFLE